MNERWHKIDGYDYFVSEHGEIMNKNGNIRKLQIDKDGYRNTGLWKNGNVKYFRVNRLVATYFIPNPDNKPQVDHIIPVSDGGTDDVLNLRWVTDEENKNNPNSLKKKFGENNSFYGKHHSEETKQKMYDNQDEKIKNIVMINTITGDIKEYHGINKCIRENKFDERAVYRCLIKKYAKRKNGTYKNVYKGYKFYYKEEYEELNGSTGRN